MKVRCLHPLTVKNPYTKEWIEVPCNKCAACLCTRQGKWVQRLNQEMKFSKFNIFFTLTYDNEHLPIYRFDLHDYGNLCSPTEEQSLEFYDIIQKILTSDTKSQNLVELYNGIPYARKSDFQKFIKRLRQSVYRCKEILEPQKVLRYYAVSEFGPTSYRSHIHGILFIESQYFFDNASRFISQAWSSLDKHTNQRTSLGRIDVQGVVGDVANYVASYLGSFTDLPKILQCKAFKPWSLFSTHPPLGSHSFSRESLQSILNGETTCFTLTNPQTYEVVSLPLWRTFEATWFPRCVGYYRLSFRDRLALYGISSLFETFSDFLSFVRSQWEDIMSSHGFTFFGVLHRAFRFEEFKHCSGEVTLPKELQDAFLRQWRISNRVRLLRSKFNLSLYDYLRRLERYYENKNYQCLKSQLQFEQDFVSNSNNSLSDLLTFIDPLFYENKRSLPFDVRQEYLSQFGLSLESIDKHIFSDSNAYREMVFPYLQYVRNGKNKKLRNEYLDAHPELLKLHSL